MLCKFCVNLHVKYVKNYFLIIPCVVISTLCERKICENQSLRAICNVHGGQIQPIRILLCTKPLSNMAFYWLARSTNGVTNGTYNRKNIVVHSSIRFETGTHKRSIDVAFYRGLWDSHWTRRRPSNIEIWRHHSLTPSTDLLSSSEKHVTWKQTCRIVHK